MYLSYIYIGHISFSAKYLKNLPLQPVLSKRNLQVVDNFENMPAAFMLKETWECSH